MPDPSVDDHAIVFNETGFRMPMSLHGIFSYFPTSKPSVEDMTDLGEVYLLSPPSWDPHNEAYAKNEETFLD